MIFIVLSLKAIFSQPTDFIDNNTVIISVMRSAYCDENVEVISDPSLAICFIATIRHIQVKRYSSIHSVIET